MECRLIIQQRNKKIQDIVAGNDPIKLEPANPITPAFIGQTQFNYSSTSAYHNKFDGQISVGNINIVDTIEVREQSTSVVR